MRIFIQFYSNDGKIFSYDVYFLFQKEKKILFADEFSSNSRYVFAFGSIRMDKYLFCSIFFRMLFAYHLADDVDDL